MQPRRSTVVFLLLALPSLAGPARAGELAPGLVRQLDGRAGTDVVRVLVVLRDQVDTAALDAELRSAKAARPQRHATIVGSLQRTAARSQADLLAGLAADKAAGGVLGFTPHWLVNAVVVTGTVAAVHRIAARDDVLRIEADLVPALIEPVGDARPGKSTAGIGIAPGVVAIGARRVWDELGFDGTGTLVGIIDSGADGAHPAFAARWQGNFAPAAESWLDASQFGHTVPTDVQGHGTHVLGILTGQAPGDTIGVAPGARWIATNGIQAATANFDNAIMASLEFMADPDGNPATTDDVPDVVNNSWGVNESFAGYLDCDSRWWDLIDNCEAAGVVLVWAAGNEGPIAGTLRSPADRAANPYDCFSVGSTSNHAPFDVSGFSSRGPSGCGGAYAIKPEICAPGDTIYSALPGGGYIHRNGTSMAAPHVAGVVALMRQANPDVDVVTIKDILMNTALDLAPTGEDNDSGHGLVDAWAAVQAVMSGIGTVGGVVTAADSGLPVAGAVVRRDGGENLTVTDGAGAYSLTLYAGPASFTATAFGFLPGTVNVTVPDGGLVAGDITLTPYPTAVISGTVRGPDGQPVAGATVRAVGVPVAPAISDTAGFYSLALPATTGVPYDLRAAAPDLGYVLAVVDLIADTTVDFDLPELTREDFESGGFTSYAWGFTGNFPWQVDTNEVHEGAFSARSADIANGQTSGLHLDYYVAAPGELSFWFKVSTEAEFDFLYFLRDGQIAGTWSGDIDWTRYAIELAQGNHQFDWVYVKDEAVSELQDAVWLDLIEFPVTGIEQFPSLAVDAPSVALTLTVGATATRTLLLGNTGGADLEFSLAAAPLGKREAGPPVKVPGPVRGPLAKGEKDRVATVPVTADGAGGPDAYGYTWVDGGAPDGPAFDWVDISAVGTPVGALDDFSYGPFDPGFPFVFYGQVFRSLRINSNGFVSFTGTSSPYVNPHLPDPALPDAVVAPFWDDLDPSAGGAILHWADPAADRFVVQYQDVPRYGSAATETFQVILHGDGSIVCQYLDVNETGFCTVGIESPAGDDGVTALYNSDGYLVDGLALRFQPPGFLPWVAISPLAGTVPPAGEATVSLDFDATGLEPGIRLATLTISSNDPAQPTVLVPLILTVEAPSAVPEPELPRALTLSGAVPNPFNPRTEIHFALPRAGRASLRVHDVRGRLVADLCDAPLAAGPHVVVWDGRDRGGRTVASGTYFARLVAGGESRVAAMALVR